jgi:hypothetical protein
MLTKFYFLFWRCISRFRIIVFLAFISSLIYSCINDTGILGLGIIPPSDNMLVNFDTSLTFNSFTIYDDSVRSDEGVLNPSTSYNLLGSYIDPVFGMTKADFITQILLSSNNVNFGENLTIDSIVLRMRIGGHYGLERNGTQTVKVFRLTDSINIDSSYYSNLDIENYYNSNLIIGQTCFTPGRDSIISVHLDPEMLYVLYSDTSVLVNNETFLKSFFGLYVTTDSVNCYGTIYYINLLSSYSKLTVYYRNNSGNAWIHSAADRKTYNFVFSSNCARVNLFRHNYSAAQYPFIYNDSLYNDSLIYIQATGGVKGKFSYNNLRHWADSLCYDPVKHDSMRIAISRAELVFDIFQDYRTPFEYSAPIRLSLVAVNKNDSLEPLADQVVASSYFDGYYNSGSQIYKFNISLHLQQLINREKENFDFYYIYPSDNRGTANRVILKNSNKNRIKLQLTYIKY